MLKCIICGEEAKFQIKGTSNYYCEECAKEYFGDISMLIKVENEAKKLTKFLNKKISKNKHL